MIIAYSIEASAPESARNEKFSKPKKPEMQRERESTHNSAIGEKLRIERKVKSDSKRRFIVKAGEFFKKLKLIGQFDDQDFGERTFHVAASLGDALSNLLITRNFREEFEKQPFH